MRHQAFLESRFTFEAPEGLPDEEIEAIAWVHFKHAYARGESCIITWADSIEERDAA